MAEARVEPGRGAPLKPLIYLGLGVAGLWAGSFVLILFSVADWAQRGQLGDLFGAVNSLFSGLAFAGLIYTVYLQREELSLQRKELQLTRDELQRTATAQEESKKALQKQVDALETTARLSALASIVEHYQVLIAGMPVARDKLQAEERQREFIRRLEKLVEEIEARHESGG
jgi:hypothetical protein